MRPALVTGLLALLVVDALLIGLDMLSQLQDWPDPRWSIEQDGGFAERWQYLKEALAAALLLQLAWRGESVSRQACLAWALLFLWVLLDDVLAMHESLGQRLMPEAPAVGELLFMLAVGLLLLYGILRAHWRAGPEWRPWSYRLELGLLAFAFFAVGVDLLHALVQSPLWHPILGLIEDGGEMLCMSALLWIVLSLWRARRPGTAYPAAG